MKLYPLGSLCLAVISLSLLPFISRKQKIQPADGRRERERPLTRSILSHGMSFPPLDFSFSPSIGFPLPLIWPAEKKKHAPARSKEEEILFCPFSFISQEKEGRYRSWWLLPGRFLLCFGPAVTTAASSFH